MEPSVKAWYVYLMPKLYEIRVSQDKVKIQIKICICQLFFHNIIQTYKNLICDDKCLRLVEKILYFEIFPQNQNLI